MPASLALDPAAVFWSAGEADRAGRPLLVLLHGYGSHEGDLFQLSPHLPLGPVIASVRAPIPENGGFAWFSHDDFVDDAPTLERADAAVAAVIDWLDSLPAAPSVSLLGFSQGAAVVLQLLRRAPERFAAAVALSGYVVPGDDPADARLAVSRPEVFWGRGTADTVIRPDAVERTALWVPEHTAADIRIYEGLTHGISTEELADVSRYISERV